MEVKKINTNEFNEMLNNKESFVVDFYADWCGPCQMFLPVFNKHAETENMKMVKINIDDDQEAAKQAGASSVPHIKIYLEGEKFMEHTGFMSPDELKSFIDKAKS